MGAVTVIEHGGGSAWRVKRTMVLVTVFVALCLLGWFVVQKSAVLAAIAVGLLALGILLALWQTWQRLRVRIEASEGVLVVESTRWPLRTRSSSYPLDTIEDAVVGALRTRTGSGAQAFLEVCLVVTDGKKVAIAGGTAEECTLTAAEIAAALPKRQPKS